jgi:predicted  nucleic acid-binding Zn-ribbon protein
MATETTNRPIDDLFDKDKTEVEDRRLAINDIAAAYGDAYRDGEKQINEIEKSLRALRRNVRNYDPSAIVDLKKKIARAKEKLTEIASDYEEQFLEKLK